MKDKELFGGYENGPAVLRKALTGMTREQLMAQPVPGKWSTQQVAIHLSDADSVFAHRLKRIIAEDHPSYSEWSENAFAAKLAYEHQSAEDAVQVIEANHQQMVKVFKVLPDGWLDRTGTHSVRGVQTARQVLEMAVWHIAHHLKFVEEKKSRLGI